MCASSSRWRSRANETGLNPQIDVNPDVTARPALEQNIWLDEWPAKTKALAFLPLAEFSLPPDGLVAGLGIDWDRLDLSLIGFVSV